MIILKAGSTSNTVYVVAFSTVDGSRLTGLAYNTASLVAYYTLAGAAPAAITLATQTPTGAWSSGGFVEVDATKCPGLYRLDLPDAAIASGNQSIISLNGAANMSPITKEIMLTAFDLQAAVAQTGDTYARLGAPAGASVSADIAAAKTDTAAVKVQTDKMAFTVSNKIDSNVLYVNGTKVNGNGQTGTEWGP